MKHYNQPETKFLQVVNSSIICASGGPAPAPFTGQLGTMKNTDKSW